MPHRLMNTSELEFQLRDQVELVQDKQLRCILKPVNVLVAVGIVSAYHAGILAYS
jgi:hypothetical protein